ncbi:MAG TPA: hypothetical protein VGC41_11900, partial [Kofleriaceae bacterium]
DGTDVDVPALMHRLVWVMVLVGCEGKAPPNGSNPTDSGTEVDAPMVDAGSGATTAKVSGKVLDYFTGLAAPAAAVTTDGLDPAVAATSGADGAYAIDVAVGSKLFATASKANYRLTRSENITVADQPVTLDVYAVGAADVTRQFSSAGVTAASGTIVIVDLQKDNGDPFPALPATAITVTDSANAAVTTTPYFIGAMGDIDLAVTTSTAYDFHGTARTRAALLNLAPGRYTVTVAFNDGAARTYNTPVTVDAGGATLALAGGANALLNAISPITDPSFATDIYPRLQTAAKGGLGCANCHTAGGPAAVLKYDDTDPAVVLTNIKAAANVINAATPAASLFLTNPLYETTPPQNHPNATFLDVNDTSYKLFLLWITNGTKP